MFKKKKRHCQNNLKREQKLSSLKSQQSSIYYLQDRKFIHFSPSGSKMSESHLSTSISSSCTFVCLVSKNTDKPSQHFFSSQISMKVQEIYLTKLSKMQRISPGFFHMSFTNFGYKCNFSTLNSNQLYQDKPRINPIVLFFSWCLVYIKEEPTHGASQHSHVGTIGRGWCIDPTFVFLSIIQK